MLASELEKDSESPIRGPAEQSPYAKKISAKTPAGDDSGKVRLCLYQYCYLLDILCLLYKCDSLAKFFYPIVCVFNGFLDG